MGTVAQVLKFMATIAVLMPASGVEIALSGAPQVPSMTRRAMPLTCLIASLVALSVSGCASTKPKGTIHSVSSSKQHERVSLVYRTESDRLNVGSGLAAETVAYQSPAGMVLPGVTVSTLKILHPHPYGVPGHALAKLTFRPTGDQGALASGWNPFAGRTGSELEPPGPGQQGFETWALDVPLWQVENIVAKLKADNYFSRSKSLQSSAFLGVKLDDVGFGKNYAAVPELDAMLLRVRMQGRPLGPPVSPQDWAGDAPPGVSTPRGRYPQTALDPSYRPARSGPAAYARRLPRP